MHSSMENPRLIIELNSNLIRLNLSSSEVLKECNLLSKPMEVLEI